MIVKKSVVVPDGMLAATKAAMLPHDLCTGDTRAVKRLLEAGLCWLEQERESKGLLEKIQSEMWPYGCDPSVFTLEKVALTIAIYKRRMFSAPVDPVVQDVLKIITDRVFISVGDIDPYMMEKAIAIVDVVRNAPRG